MNQQGQPDYSKRIIRITTAAVMVLATIARVIKELAEIHW